MKTSLLDVGLASTTILHKKTAPSLRHEEHTVGSNFQGRKRQERVGRQGPSVYWADGKNLHFVPKKILL